MFCCPQTLNTGSLMWATALVAGYGYMVLSWGGYSFVINLLPIYCLTAIVTGRLTSRLYVAFAPLVVVGTLLAGGYEIGCTFLWRQDCMYVRTLMCVASLVVVGTLLAGGCRFVCVMCVCAVCCVDAVLLWMYALLFVLMQH